MIRERLSLYRARIRRELTDAFEEEHTAREIAASFAIGIFVTALPTGGVGICLFFVLAYYWEWISKTAIFASVVVLNPFVKPVVYVASYQAGASLVGTEPIAVFDNAILDYTVTTIQLVLVGNVLIACGLAATSYVVVLRLTRSHRRRRRSGDAISPQALFGSLFQRWRK